MITSVYQSIRPDHIHCAMHSPVCVCVCVCIASYIPIEHFSQQALCTMRFELLICFPSSPTQHFLRLVFFCFHIHHRVITACVCFAIGLMTLSPSHARTTHCNTELHILHCTILSPFRVAMTTTHYIRTNQPAVPLFPFTHTHTLTVSR